MPQKELPTQPEYLFHYTTVDTLELILQNRTIRLNPLDKMDDPDEKWSRDDTESGKLFFISSWTEKPDEDPRMWLNYCKPSHTWGVRIRLVANPFSIEKNVFQTFGDLVGFSINCQCYCFAKLGLIKKDAPLEYEEHLNLLEQMRVSYPNEYRQMQEQLDYLSHHFPTYYPDSVSERILHKVEYTEEEARLFPRTHHFTEVGNYATFEQFGMAKRTKWSWQQEWRYMIAVLNAKPGCNHNNQFVTMYPSVNYVDLIIDDNAFTEMEITKSPTLVEEASVKLERIVASNNPSAIIKESVISPSLVEKACWEADCQTNRNDCCKL